MPLIEYIDRKFRPESLAIIDLANDICRDMERQGYDLTLRQLYYQFIRRDYFPNSEKSYDRLGSIVNDARLAGLIDWDHLTDRTRTCHEPYTNENLTDVFDGVEYRLAFDRWKEQNVHMEVWVEKQALEQVVQRAANAMQVPYLACKGYMSQSEQHEAAMRMLGKIRDGKRIVLLHLGDHDPSGIDMTRDNRERLTGFITHHLVAAEDGWEHPVDPNEHDELDLGEIAHQLYDCPSGYESGEPVIQVNRIALNMDQVRQYDPPPNPAKMSDSRAADYIGKFGRSSWELDALDPATLNQLIRDAIMAEMDVDAFNAAGDAETVARAKVRNWIDERLPELEAEGLA